MTVSGSDLAGNPLTGTRTFSFGTGFVAAGPGVVGASPDPGMLDVPTDSRITIHFDEPMELTATHRALQTTPPVSMTYSSDASAQTLTWTPTAPLAPGTMYDVTLPTTARSQRGTAIGADYVFGFTTATGPDTTAPSVNSFLPLDDAIGEPRHFEIAIAFSEPMDHAWTQAALVFPSHPSLGGTFTWTTSGTVMRFRPDVDPEHGELVEWALLGDARDLAGNPIGTDTRPSFRVIRVVVVDLFSVDAIDGEVAVPPDGVRVVQTDTAMIDTGSINYTYYGPSIQRGFLSFDLGALPAGLTRIQAAYLRFWQQNRHVIHYEPEVRYGDCTDLGSLYLEKVHIGPALTQSAFDTAVLDAPLCDPADPTVCPVQPFVLGAPCQEARSIRFTAGITAVIAQDWANRVSQQYRSQWRLRNSVEATDVWRSRTFYSGNWRTPDNRLPRLHILYEIP